MSLMGFGQGANAGFSGLDNYAQSQYNMQKANDLVRQAQARAQAYKLLQAMAQGAGPQSPSPGAPVLPSGVSPQGTGAPPPSAGAGNPAGGTGGPATALPTAGTAFAGIDPGAMQRLLMQKAATLQGGSPGANFDAFQMLNQSLNPQMNALDRMLMQQQRLADTDYNKQADRDSRKEIAQMNATMRQNLAKASQAVYKFKDDAKGRALADVLTARRSAYTASNTKDNLAALNEAIKAVNDYADSKTSGGNGAAAAGTSAAPPVEGAKQAPDGNWYIQKDGQYYQVTP